MALWFFTTRDDATTSGPVQQAPGQPLREATPYAQDLQRGNVVLAASRDEFASAHALAGDVAGPDDPALRAAGQAVLVRRATAPGVSAFAEGRTLHAATAGDPELRAFVEYWLGRAAG